MSEAVKTLKETLIADRYRVSLDQRIPELDTPGAVAYAAADLVRPEQAVFILVLRPGMPYRENNLKKLQAERRSLVMCPLAQEILNIPSGELAGDRLAIVIPYPGGGHVFPQGLIVAPMTEKELKARVIPQLLEALDGLHTMGITHRGLTLKNIFCHTDGKLVLGECFTSPPGYILSPAEEPMETAQATREARGEGAPPHDMYALGVLIMSLFLGRNLGEIFGSLQTDEFNRVMKLRLRHGSYQAFAAGYEITGTMGDLLRGLLNDRVESRWDADDVQRWIGGASSHTKVGDERWVLVRPIAFEDKIIQDRRELAFCLSRNVPAAAKLIRNGKFLHWIQNTLVEAVESVWLERFLDTRPASMVGENPLADDWAVARVCAVLDPEGPLRFKGQAFSIDGLGCAMAVFLANDQADKQDILRTLIAGEPFRTLLEMLKERNSKISGMHRRLFDSSKYIESTALGYGFERVLYLLNPQITCCSSRLAAYHSDTTTHLLHALELRAGDDNSDGVVDPHIAAFIVSQNRDMEEAVRALDQSKKNPSAFSATTLKLLAALQKKFRAHRLPHLARVMSEPVRKAIAALHSRTYQRQLGQRLDNLVEVGDLTRLEKEMNIRGIKLQDDKNFRTAQFQFATIKRECARLERPLMPNDPAARQLGYLGSACLSVSILLVTGIYLLLHVARWN